MRRDFEAVRRQFLTAERALRNLNPESDSLPAFQKVYDIAKAQYEDHPNHPKNKVAKRRAERHGKVF